MKLDIDFLTKITVRGNALTEMIPTDVVYREIVWGLVGVVWNAETAEFICTYEKTDTEPGDPTDTIKEINEILYFN